MVSDNLKLPSGHISTFKWTFVNLKEFGNKFLQSCKSDGGFALPNFRQCYWTDKQLKLPYWLGD